MPKQEKLKYDQHDIRTNEQDSANSVIMELACELADNDLIKKMRVKSIDSRKVTRTDEDGCTIYTDKAQDIFNELYNQKMDEVYEAANKVGGKITAKSLRKAMAKKK